MTRRRAFWPGQSGQSVPPGFLGDDEGGDRPPAPRVRWRRVEHPLYPEDVDHGGPDSTADESYTSHESYGSYMTDEAYARDGADEAGSDEFAPYDRYGRFDDQYLVEADDGDGDDGLGRYEVDWYDSDGAGSAGGGGTEGERRPVGLYRFDDLAPPADARDVEGDVDPTEPLGDVLRDGGGRDDPGAVLRAMLADRDDFRVEARRRGSRGRWRLTLAERLVAAWPGQSEEGAPPGFPASGELVLHPRPPATGGNLVRLPVRGPSLLDSVADDDAPIFDLAGDHDDDEGGDDAAPHAEVRVGKTSSVARGRFGGRRPAAAGGERSERSPSAVPGLPSPRSLQKVAMAVYAALADPIVNADPEARERRTVQARRLGLLAGSAALAVVLIYAIFPVRTYLEQRAATQRARERIDKLSEANAELEQRKEQLRDDETVEEIARRDYQLVFPGEESYGLLPPPVPPTTTTTPPGG